jgi:hypothetical protein
MVKGEYDELLQKVGEVTRLLEDILPVVLKRFSLGRVMT